MFSFQTVFAETSVDYTNEANMLKSLGLFNGTKNGYELDRVPSRVEAAAMLVRLLGAEEDAKQMNYKHPFTDVPEWANSIVGYMYEKGYTKGISDNKFGSEQLTNARDYTTFMLRTLGYDADDFNWEKSIDFAVEKEMITLEEAQSLQGQTFKRNEMVFISYNTLKTKANGESDSLVKKLVDSGVITAQKASDAGVVHYETLPIKIWKDGSYYKCNIYLSQLNPELKKAYNGSSGGDSFLDFDNKEFLAKYTLLTNNNKKTTNVSDDLNTYYYPEDYTIHTFYDDDNVLSNYAIFPRNVTEGEYNIAIQPVSEELRNLILKSEEAFKQYKAEKAAKISIIPAKAYKIEKGEDDKNYITIDKSKLPDSMKNFIYCGQSGSSSDDIQRSIDRMLHTYFAREDAHRNNGGAYVDGEAIELYYSGYTRFTLFDENKDVIGITIFEVD